MVLVRRIASAAAAAVAAVGLVTFVPAPAAADTVTVRWGCGSPLGPGGQADYDVTITAPATARVGQTATVRVSIADRRDSTWNEPAGRYTGKVRINLTGAGTSSIDATGLANPELRPGMRWRLDGGQAQITFGTTGTVSYTPSSVQVSIDGFFRYICGGTAPVAATTRVS